MKDTYLSDEELLQLMEQVETEELVEAPEYLAENIMKQVEKSQSKAQILSYNREIREPELQTKKKPPRNKRKELVAYGFKVMLSAAASIAILLAIPAAQGGSQTGALNSQNTQVVQEKDTDSRPVSNALSSINKATSSFCNLLNQSSTDYLTNRKLEKSKN